MSRIILQAGLTIILVLFSYSHAEAATLSAIIAANDAVYSADADPDGDNNIKGWDYFVKSRSATGDRIFIFDPNYHAWAVYDEDGLLVNTGKASGGKLYCPDVGRRCTTVVGEFTVVAKGGADCISSKYPIETNGGAPMPYCMHFGNKGYAVHGSNDVPEDGNASHGCIRVTPIAAKWLNHHFLEVGSKVVVLPYSSDGEVKYHRKRASSYS